MEASLRKYGNSTVAVIPPTILKALKLHSGSEIDMSVSKNSLILTKKNTYRLEDLLAECDSSAQLSASDDLSDWDKAPPVGNEVW